MFQVRIVFHTWKSGLLLFYRTENVRENTFACTEYTEARHWYRKHTSGVPLLTKKQLSPPPRTREYFTFAEGSASWIWRWLWLLQEQDEKAKKEFQEINAEYFKAIYFSLAPLLCVPMYQQIRPLEAIYGRGTLKRSSFWEDESLTNFWGEDRFKHPSCVTDSILKTEKREAGNGDSVITVYAYGYRRMQRLTYASVWGGDGRSHQVPVYRDEYISVTGQGSIRIREDIDFEDSAISQRERLDHINTVLDIANLNIYRRHIAPKV